MRALIHYRDFETMPNLMDNKDSQSPSGGLWLHRLVRRPLGLPVFEFFVVFVVAVGLVVSVALPLAAWLLRVLL